MATEKKPSGAKSVKGSKAKTDFHTQTDRSLLVRRSMLNAAAELFAEKGFGGANLRDVADALGMSRPSLYYHFASKEKILEALIEEVTDSAAKKLKEIEHEADRDPEEALRLVMQMLIEWILENHVLFRVLDRTEVEMSPDLVASHAESKKEILGHFTRIIERGVAIGKFRPVDSRVAALAIVGMRNWVAWWYNPTGRLPKQEIVETITEMAVRSLLRSDAHRSRSDQLTDVLRILKEDVAHISQLSSD